MSFLKHPAHADPHADLWAHARFDGADTANNDGGNTDEDPDTFSGFTNDFTGTLSSLSSINTGIDLPGQLAINAIAGPLGFAVGLGNHIANVARANGLSVSDPTTNDINGAGNLSGIDLFDIVSGNDVDLILADDFTKRIDNPENYVTRRRLADIYKRAAENSGGSELGDWYADQKVAGVDDTRFLQEMFGSQPATGLGDDDWDWNQPGNVWRFLRTQLGDETFAPYAIVDRDFGNLTGFNKSLAQQYEDFGGDFGSGEFGEYATEAGIWDEVNAAKDAWFGNNDDLNMALSTEFGFEGPFDGNGSFWNFVDQEGIDRSQVNNFIDQFNGTGDFANPFDGTSTTTGIGTSGTGTVGGGGTYVDTFQDGMASMFSDFSNALLGSMEAYQTDLSSIFSDLPDYSMGPDVVRGNPKEMSERSGVDQLRIDLDQDLLRTRRRSNFGAIPFTGLQF